MSCLILRIQFPFWFLVSIFDGIVLHFVSFLFFRVIWFHFMPSGSCNVDMKNYRHVRLVYKPYFFSQRTVFFSHNKSTNGTFSHGLSAKRTGQSHSKLKSRIFCFCYYTVLHSSLSKGMCRQQRAMLRPELFYLGLDPAGFEYLNQLISFLV